MPISRPRRESLPDGRLGRNFHSDHLSYGRITGMIFRADIVMDPNLSVSENAAPAAIDTLKQNEHYYYFKMIEEVVDYAIFLLNPDGIVQNWNRGAQRIKGYTEQEIVGQHFRIFYLPQDQAAGLPERLLAEARARGRSVNEGWRVRKDGTKLWVSIVITAVHDDNGDI